MLPNATEFQASPSSVLALRPWLSSASGSQFVAANDILEYNSVVWSPSLMQDIRRIEKVQRHFTKCLPGLQNLSYSDRLRRLSLTSLERRRLEIDFMCYKIIFSLISLQCSTFLQFNVSNTRGNKYKLQKYYCGNCTMHCITF